MAFNIDSTIKLKTVNKINTTATNNAFKQKFYDDVEVGTYEEIDYNTAVGIDIEEGIVISEKVKEDREKAEKLKEEQAKKAAAAKKNKNVEAAKKDTGSSWWDYARTAIGGAVEGFLGIGEGVVDAHLYGTGIIIKGLTMGNYGDGLAYDAVAYDVSGKVENAINYGVDEDIKNSGWSNTPRVIGHGLGYQALSKVPFVGVALAAQGGAGKEAEKSMNKQMAETGTINEWTVFYRSFLGSIEGFIGSKLSKAADKYKAVGSEGIVSGVKNLSKQGFGAFVKNQGLVFKSAAQNSLKDPRIWADMTGITFKKFESILAGTYSKTDLALDLLGIPMSTKFWDGVGEAGLSFVEMFK